MLKIESIYSKKYWNIGGEGMGILAYTESGLLSESTDAYAPKLRFEITPKELRSISTH